MEESLAEVTSESRLQSPLAGGRHLRSGLRPIHLLAVFAATFALMLGVARTARATSPAWVRQSLDATSTSPGLNRVHFVDRYNGWAVGDGIFHTNDCGATWKSQSTQSGLYGVFAIDAAFTWVAGGAPNEYGRTLFANTRNAGWTWDWAHDGAALFSDVEFIEHDRGWVSGSNSYWGEGPASGIILRTMDGGSTWATSTVSSPVRAIDFVSGSTGFALDDRAGVMRTVDGGRTWIKRSTIANPMNDICFVSGYTGWAVGYPGVILRTGNGGRTWSRQRSGTTKGLNAVRFVNRSTGWAVGDGGVVLKTSNGGRTWRRLTVSTTSTLHSVWFSDAQYGWIVGDSGTIFATTTGGVSR